MNSKIDSNPNISLKHSEILKDVKKSILNTQIQNIIDYPEIRKDFEKLSSNPNLIIKNVLDHPEIPWNWTALSSNPNLSIKY
jgi:hypothetical protein